MWLKIFLSICLFLHIAKCSNTENSKFLGNSFYEEERRNGKRKKRPGYSGNGGNSPCNFGGGYSRPRSEELGRTFFDLQYFNFEQNYHYNINCGGGGNYPAHTPSQINKPISDNLSQIGHKPLGGHHKPILHKPGGHENGFEGIIGGNGGHKPGGLGSFGGGGGHKPHKPLGGGIFNRPGGIFGGNNDNEGASTAPYNGPFAGIFPSPPQVANGFSQGIQTFIGTIPAIGQSFQSILPNFNDFQFSQRPQLFNPAGSSNKPFNNYNRPQGGTSPPYVSTTIPTTTIDPGDIIYSDQIKPVHEDYDPITDPYFKDRRPPNNRYYGRQQDVGTFRSRSSDIRHFRFAS
ncbi:uncharacterized protein LOC126740465 [Anthonomus grandis grandis]|uniref:uncharacterized protein LOC126740465 n=1 Tax=Anthonomus grandis grandis TaxID=2921223 RepID=UPI0021666E4E|nr:uncharacterized protein LOC126740465 [Anthonomus grandis grandis]